MNNDSIYDEEYRKFFVEPTENEKPKIDNIDELKESYLKLVDLYPKSNFLLKAESVYESCLKMKNNINKK